MKDNIFWSIASGIGYGAALTWQEGALFGVSVFVVMCALDALWAGVRYTWRRVRA